MKTKLKNKLFTIAALASLVLVANCGGTGNSNPGELQKPTLIVSGGDEPVTAIVAEGETLSFKVVMDVPGGFQELRVTSDQGKNEIVTEAPDNLEMEYTLSTQDSELGTEKFSFVVVDQDGLESDAAEVTIENRLPAKNYFVSLEDLGKDPFVDSFLNAYTGDTYSLMDTIPVDFNDPVQVEEAEATKGKLDFFLYITQGVPNLVSPGSELADQENWVWENGDKNITLFKFVNGQTYADLGAMSNRDRVLALDELMSDDEGEDYLGFAANEAIAFRTSDGINGIILGGLDGDSSVGLKIYINQ